VFRHNQHQVEQARELSKQLGCQNFAVKLTSRFVDKTHNLVDATPVYENSQPVYFIRPPSDKNYLNPGYEQFSKKINNDYNTSVNQVSIKCMTQQTGLLQITAEGYVLPCAWIYDRFYGFEPEQTTARKQIFALIEETGGLDKLSLYNHSILDIVKGKFFTAVQESWAQNKLQRCAHQCGLAVDLHKNSHKNFTELSGPRY